jgi:hypothetical protein
MLRLSQFGYHTLIAVWLFPIMCMAFIGNATSTGIASDFYAIASVFTVSLFGFASWSAYLNRSGTATVAAAQSRAASHDDAAVVSFENLSAWKWVYCLLISIIAATSAVTHYIMNRESQGILATALLIYAVIDILIGLISFKQFWDIKSGQIVQLSNKVADNMFQH